MLLYTEKKGNTSVAVWKIEESKEELLSKLEKKELLSEILSAKSETKIKERLAVRVLLKHLTGKELQINYHPSGKPSLATRTENISVSHTKGYVAVMLTNMSYAGLDIQAFTDKIYRVRSRFISEKEYIHPEKEHIHLLLHWSAKESVYKSLGIAGISLSNDILVEKFIPESYGIMHVTENITGKKIRFTIKYTVENEYVFTVISHIDNTYPNH